MYRKTSSRDFSFCNLSINAFNIKSSSSLIDWWLHRDEKKLFQFSLSRSRTCSTLLSASLSLFLLLLVKSETTSEIIAISFQYSLSRHFILFSLVTLLTSLKSLFEIKRLKFHWFYFFCYFDEREINAIQRRKWKLQANWNKLSGLSFHSFFLIPLSTSVGWLFRENPREIEKKREFLFKHNPVSESEYKINIFPSFFTYPYFIPNLIVSKKTRRNFSSLKSI